MSMSDADNGKVLWQSRDWADGSQAPDSSDIKEARIPAQILQCRAVSRSIEFWSAAAREHLRLHQRVLLDGECIENWHFKFGFVIPGSTNTWQTEIEAAPPDEMLPAELLSGRLVIETVFLDGDTPINRSSVRVVYVG